MSPGLTSSDCSHKRQAPAVSGNLKRSELKSLKKTALRFIKFGVIAILTLYVGLFLYYKFGWRSHYSKPQVDNIVSTIQNTPKLSDSFYIVYDKIYSDRHEKITNRYWKNFWTEFITMNGPIHNNWQYVSANMQPYKGFRYKIAPMTLAFRISNDVSPEKCFDYVMTKLYSNYSTKFKLSDTITNLTKTDKIINFIVASQRPHYYRVHPTMYKQEADSLKQLLFTQ